MAITVNGFGGIGDGGTQRGHYYLKKLAHLKQVLPRNIKYIFESPKTYHILNEFENSLASYLNHARGGERVPVLTDFYLPAANLENFLSDLKVVGEKLNLDLALYGSYSTSNYSLRPRFDLEDPDFNKKVATFLRAGAYVINRQNGSLTGGTPEGRLKSVVTNTEMLEPTKNLYLEIKKLFDQNGILNPDVKLGASSKFTLTHFRDSSLPTVMM